MTTMTRKQTKPHPDHKHEFMLEGAPPAPEHSQDEGAQDPGGVEAIMEAYQRTVQRKAKVRQRLQQIAAMPAEVTLLTIEEVAELFCVTRSTVYQWMKQGLRYVDLPGTEQRQVRRISKQALADFISQYQQGKGGTTR